MFTHARHRARNLPLEPQASYLSLLPARPTASAYKHLPGMHSTIFPDRQYANVTLFEKLTLILLLIPLPIYVLVNVLASPFISHFRTRTWKRVIGDSAFHYVGSYLSLRQLQFAFGTTRDVYTAWAKQSALPMIVDDDIGEGARLLWIGERRKDKIILYIHGGAFLLPAFDFALSFWKYILGQLSEKHGKDVGFTMVNYSLAPTVDYPTPLKQTISAIQFLVQSGVNPQNIILTGDSAGANAILQIFSHMLHPIAGIPPLSLDSKLGGAYLMSPWVSLTDTHSFAANSASDILPASVFESFAVPLLPYVPDSQRMYIEALKAPDSWFEGVDRVVDRVLITAGSLECFKDTIVEFARDFAKHHHEVTFVVQDGGVHDDPYFDFLLKEKRLGDLTPLIISWLADSCR